MQTQITTHAAGHPTTVQIGATLVKFVEQEGKFVSEFVQKEVADLMRGIEGYEFTDFTDAEVKKITSGGADVKVADAIVLGDTPAAEDAPAETEATGDKPQAKKKGE